MLPFFLVILGLINLRNFIKKIKSDKDIFTDSKQNLDRSFNFNIPSDLQQQKKLFLLFKKKYSLIDQFVLFDVNKFLNLFIKLLLAAYGLLALCPITNADSLDYHIGVAIEILNQGKMPAFFGWFHGRLAGSGEVLNALGLAIGAEQFGSLLQFSGLLGIYGILAFYSFMEKVSVNSVWRKIIIIAFLSSPVLVFLVSSSKPQLLQIGMTSFAVVLLLEIILKAKTDKNKLSIFVLICMLIMSATQAKFFIFFVSIFNRVLLSNFIRFCKIIYLWGFDWDILLYVNNFSFCILEGKKF